MSMCGPWRSTGPSPAHRYSFVNVARTASQDDRDRAGPLDPYPVDADLVDPVDADDPGWRRLALTP